MGVVPLVGEPSPSATVTALTGTPGSGAGAPEPSDACGLLQTLPVGARLPAMEAMSATVLGRP